MANDPTLPSIPEPEVVEDKDIKENDEVQENSCTSSNGDENSEDNHGEEKMIGGMRIDNDENSVQLEQAKQKIIYPFTVFEFVAGYYAYREIRSRKLSWRGKAIRIFPMFIIPATAYFFYSLFFRKLKLEGRRSERVTREKKEKTQKLKERANDNNATRDIQTNHGESSSRTSFSGSNLPEISQIIDEIVINPSPSQVANESVAMDLVRDINQLPVECISGMSSTMSLVFQAAHSLNCHGESSSMASSPGSNLSEVPHITNETVNPNISQVADKPVEIDMVGGINQLPEDSILVCITSTAPQDSCPSNAMPHAYQSVYSPGESSSMASSLGSVLPVISPANDETMDLNLSQVANKPADVMDMFNQLPLECISLVISFTTPRDACVSSAVSHYFQSAANTDATWERFLPSDFRTILDQAVNPVEFTSKRELFFQLCDHPVLINIDGMIMSFGLERSSGAKCFMISARGLSITWGDDLQYWNWIPLPDSRFPEVAKLIDVCWLEIHGHIDSAILTEHTAYVAYLIFKLRKNRRGLGVALQETSITIGGVAVCQHLVCLDPDERQQGNYPWYVAPEAIIETEEDVNVPTERGDGFMEIELGEFNSGDGFNGNVDISFKEIRGNHWKRGLIVNGIEIRPMH